MNSRDYAYDVESLTNYFSCTIERIECGTRWIYEVCEWLNQSVELAAMIRTLGAAGCRMVGFNNVFYDYPMIHTLCDLVSCQGYATAEQLYAKSQKIIGGGRFENTVWERDRLCPQLDLYKIHHFDNPAKATSLKALQINMRAHSVEDMPFDHTHRIQNHERPVILRYNCHDVSETIRFYRYSAGNIKFRDDLSERLGRDFSNHNDTAIGKDYFLDRLEKASPGITRAPSGGKAQTPRNSIDLSQCVFPYIQFQRPEFRRVLEYLKSTTITNTKSAPELKDLSATIDGFQFDFGTGGLHGSLSNAHVQQDDEFELVDVDVESYYPNLAIKNKVFPEHLGLMFCEIYEDLFNERKSHPKKTAPNEMLKLALNGVYGESNNVYGAFLDPQYTMTITVNGQLLLCVLAEWFLTIPRLRLVQANTDGVTVLLPRSERARFDTICEAWQAFTCLKLEYANYTDMWIRDVNSYVARSVKGTMKRIGAYAYETARENPATREVVWSKDHSALVIPKAAEAALLAGTVSAVDAFVWSHDDPWGFMMKEKAPRGSRLMLDGGTLLPPTLRYYIAQSGAGLVKVMPELPSKPGSGERRIRRNVGWNIAPCNVATDFDPANLDRRFYIAEAKKLLGMLPQ